MHKFILFTLSFCLVSFTACQEATTQASLVDVQSLSLNEKNLVVYATDASLKISALVLFKDNSTQTTSKNIQWFTSDISVASVSKGEIKLSGQNGGDINITISYKKFTDSMPLHIQKLTSFSIEYPDINSSGTGTYNFRAYGNFENNETNRSIVNNIIWKLNSVLVTDIVDGVATLNIKTGDTNITATMFGETNTSSPIAPITVEFRVN